MSGRCIRDGASCDARGSTGDELAEGLAEITQEDSTVALLHTALLKRLAETDSGFASLGHNQQTTDAAVQSVHCDWTRDRARVLPRGREQSRQTRLHMLSTLVGLTMEARGLKDYSKVIIFVLEAKATMYQKLRRPYNTILFFRWNHVLIGGQVVRVAHDVASLQDAA
eukprot:4313723-Pleurochrysis_carterae.AAC.2